VLERRTKILILIFLVFAILAIFIPSEKTRINPQKTPTHNGKLPVKIVDIIFPQNDVDKLFDQFRKFAEKNAFAIRIAPTDPTGESFLVQMWRQDIKITGLDGDPGQFGVAFYTTYEEQPVPLRVFDELIIDLKGFVEEIPNITFTVSE
jgi:hypothetical protein